MILDRHFALHVNDTQIKTGGATLRMACLFDQRSN